MAYFLLKENATEFFFFMVPLFHQEWEENIWKTFLWLFGGLSRRHNGTYRIQMGRRSEEQHSLLYIPFKSTLRLNTVEFNSYFLNVFFKNFF